MNAKGQKIGYARVSTAGQNLDSQIDALIKAGCTKIFSDQQSGVSERREGFERLVEYLRSGDSLVITELSRLSRSLKHLLTLVERLEEKGVEIISLRENIDTSTATGRCFLSIMGAIAQMERELKSERANAGREAAKVRGRTGGRPRTEPQKLEQARVLYENSSQTAKEVCQAIGIGRRTFFRYLAQKRNEQPC
ncbi:recombinase family protein [Candidatus Poribacteria bacterium]|nr:recombinase family protein [Candidatus Poribacteria bacterium]